MEDCITLNSYRINHQWNRCVIRVTWIVPPFCCFATCVWFPQIKKTWIHLIWEDWLILIGPETSRKQWWCISHRPKMANRKRFTGRWTKILDHAAIKCSHFNRFFHARGHHIPTGPWPTSSRHPHVLRDEHLQLPSCAVSACHKTSSGTCPVQPTAMFKHGNCNLQHFFGAESTQQRSGGQLMIWKITGQVGSMTSQISQGCWHVQVCSVQAFGWRPWWQLDWVVTPSSTRRSGTTSACKWMTCTTVSSRAGTGVAPGSAARLLD